MTLLSLMCSLPECAARRWRGTLGLVRHLDRRHRAPWHQGGRVGIKSILDLAPALPALAGAISLAIQDKAPVGAALQGG